MRFKDPFHVLKERELFGEDGGLAVARKITRRLAGITSEEDALTFILHSALWGNRVDLSNFDVEQADRKGILPSGSAGLIRDDTPRVMERLLHARRVHVILDNAGPELVSDLLLADFLLAREGRARLVLHMKQAPFFVSDAMVKEAQQTMLAFSSDREPRVREAGTRLREAVFKGRLTLASHYFWNGPRHFTRLPEELRKSLATSDIVIVKGDANYRRLLEDRGWEPETRMEEAVSYFPAPFAALRTMKSELIVDLDKGAFAALGAEDPDWLTNGKQGIIRYCEPRTGLTAAFPSGSPTRTP